MTYSVNKYVTYTHNAQIRQVSIWKMLPCVDSAYGLNCIQFVARVLVLRYKPASHVCVKCLQPAIADWLAHITMQSPKTESCMEELWSIWSQSMTTICLLFYSLHVMIHYFIFCLGDLLQSITTLIIKELQYLLTGAVKIDWLQSSKHFFYQSFHIFVAIV